MRELKKTLKDLELRLQGQAEEFKRKVKEGKTDCENPAIYVYHTTPQNDPMLKELRKFNKNFAFLGTEIVKYIKETKEK